MSWTHQSVVALIGVTMAVPAGAATASDASAYQAYVVCSAKKSAEASHSCGVDQAKTAIFLSKDRDVTYKVCVKFPHKADKLCASHQPATEGVKSVVSITSDKLGQHTVTWFVGGEKVATYFFEVHD
jgi:hypothetical protein